MSLKAKIEAIIYAAEEPITVEQISALVKDMVLAEEAEQARAAAEMAASGEVAEQAEVAEPSASLEPAEAAAGQMDEPAVDGAAETVAGEQSVPEPANGTEIAAPAEQPDTIEAGSVTVEGPDATANKKKPAKKELSEDARVRARVRSVIQELASDCAQDDRGIEIRAVAGGFRMSTKPEHHDVVRAFAKSLKPPVRLSLAALETLAVIAYKQPVTVPEISEVRGVESGGVIGTLLDRKLITTAGRKQVVGRPILYKTSKEFLLRFGLNDIAELPSMEEFEKLASDGQGELFTPEASTEPPHAPAPAAEAPDTSAPETAPDEPVAEEATTAAPEEVSTEPTPQAAEAKTE
ncbi:MAG TPA: SMC-Scp complex subunit ScpB [Opitutus sp.]|nr:SMC-Scp complex subunit ScpB [Opitutus sp.]